jgi:hypothetical protein
LSVMKRGERSLHLLTQKKLTIIFGITLHNAR